MSTPNRVILLGSSTVAIAGEGAGLVTGTDLCAHLKGVIEEQLVPKPDPGQLILQASEPPPKQVKVSPITRPDGPRCGRNDPCPCGSGHKFKRCCLNIPKPARFKPKD